MHERPVVLTKHPVRVHAGDPIACNVLSGLCRSRGLAGAIFVEACKISGRPPTRVIRGRDVKPSSGDLHSRHRSYRQPCRTYGNIESEVTFTTSSPLFLACCQVSRGTTRHRNRADIPRWDEEIRGMYLFYSPSQCALPNFFPLRNESTNKVG